MLSHWLEIYVYLSDPHYSKLLLSGDGLDYRLFRKLFTMRHACLYRSSRSQCHTRCSSYGHSAAMKQATSAERVYGI